MKSLTEQLGKYAQYHRDLRNITTHFIGIPMIVLAVGIILSRPGAVIAGLWLSPALVVAVIASIYYLILDLRFGLTMAILLGLCAWAGAEIAGQSTMVWLSSGIGLFVLGWIIQFVGHYFEGRKPAFVDDIMGLAIGPLFVVAEMAFLLGLRQSVRQAVEAHAGPTCIRTNTA